MITGIFFHHLQKCLAALPRQSGQKLSVMCRGRPSGHCTAYTVLGSDSGTETQGESLLEINHLFVLKHGAECRRATRAGPVLLWLGPQKAASAHFRRRRSLDDWRAHRFRDQARVPAQLFKPGKAGFRG